ncbi:hypothetical protein DPMN_167214 [Dreissena polymorpha]|uniref:Uncharacterized protein n=1 Tax=Dreissena polymorpha TaxID=45954 RepID=A0A9D4F418_DREPO|nr:hypothetical protein DPMN_167214 [Dreissena polymorpha]
MAHDWGRIRGVVVVALFVAVMGDLKFVSWRVAYAVVVAVGGMNCGSASTRLLYPGVIRGHPSVGNGGPCIVEIDRIVMRDIQYQLEVNRCRN